MNATSIKPKISILLPQAANIKDSLNTSLTDSINCVFRKTPQSIQTESHRLFQLITEENWMDASTNLHHFPEQAKKKRLVCISDGKTTIEMLPLHHSCSLKPPPDIISELISYYPAAVRKTEKCYKRTPLHIACVTGASSVVVQMLLRAYPGAARIRAVYGRLPIHYACTCTSTDTREIIMKLLEAFPEAAKIRDDYGWLPLHIACVYNAKLDVLKTLVQSYPDAVFLKTTKGKLPIELCQSTKRKCSKNIVFLERYMKTKGT